MEMFDSEGKGDIYFFEYSLREYISLHIRN